MKRRSFVVLELAQGDFDIPFRLLEAGTTEFLDSTIDLGRSGVLSNLLSRRGSRRVSRRVSCSLFGVGDTACEVGHVEGVRERRCEVKGKERRNGGDKMTVRFHLKIVA